MSAAGLPRSIEWIGGPEGCVRIIDQTILPGELTFLDCHDVASVWEAIRQLRVRGAPAIGVAAAMGVVLGIRHEAPSDRDTFMQKLEEVCAYLASARPTAVNLFWALERMRAAATSDPAADVETIKTRLLAEARRIRDEDAAMCRRIGVAGEPLIAPGAGVLTHCNAGALATAEFGTALAPIYAAWERSKRFRVYVDETRPLLQGSRLTCWELRRAGVDVTLLTDGMVGSLMKAGRIDLVITGADRIAANGDTANKIGTYGIAVLAHYHGVPFYVAAPSSTFDRCAASGESIPIELRGAEEIRSGFGRLTAPPDVPCYSPAFDVTPAELIAGLITERGLIRPVSRPGIAAVLDGPGTPPLPGQSGG